MFATPDDPTAIDEAEALSPVILGHPAFRKGHERIRRDGSCQRYDAVPERSAELPEHTLFVDADETQLATAREAMRRALAWELVGGDRRRHRRIDKRLHDPDPAR